TLSGWYLTPGAHTASATVDPDHFVLETNLQDNTINQSIAPISPTDPRIPVNLRLPVQLVLPVTGQPDVDWSIGRYFDIDPRPDQPFNPHNIDIFATPTNPTQIEVDQYQHVLFTLPNYPSMDRGNVAALAAAGGVVVAAHDGEFDRWTQAGPDLGNFV